MPLQTRLKMPDIVFVVARSRPDGVIGADNKLPWHLKTDLQRFKALTLDHAVIMGRRTFASVGRPLPRRLNIVLSRGLGMGSPTLFAARTPEAALDAADAHALKHNQSKVFVIGGAEIYALFEPYCQRVHLTEIEVSQIKGDARFTYVFDPHEWKTLSESYVDASEDDDYPTRYLVLERRVPRERFRAADALPTLSSPKIR